MLTRATVPLGLPQAPRIPVCSLSAPAHDNILLMRTTWYGWARTRRWKPSLPAILTRYLLAQIRAASRASELSCSNSFDTMWMHRGKSSTVARLRPRSKMRILGSGTPRLNRDLGYGWRRGVSRLPGVGGVGEVTDRVTEVADPVPGQGPNREGITKRCKHHRWSRSISK